MNIPATGTQVTKRGITLTVDFVDDDQVFYAKHRERQNEDPDTIENDLRRFIGMYRVPIKIWNEQTL